MRDESFHILDNWSCHGLLNFCLDDTLMVDANIGDKWMGGRGKGTLYLPGYERELKT
jgi:hypothetical protein